jgi:RNA polymerase subunit RPABC4/transcription elongation factor Spt4
MSTLIKTNDSQNDSIAAKEDIVCPKCGTKHPWYRVHCSTCKINLQDMINKNISDLNDNQLFISCINCSHLYSKRADKCPKCGTPVKDVCKICKKAILKTSQFCPECGDPDPFDISSEIVTKPQAIIEKKSENLLESHKPNLEKIKPKNTNLLKSFWKWSIIIFSVFFLAPVFSNIAYFMIYNLFYGELPTANPNRTLPSGFLIMVAFNLIVMLWTFKFVQTLFKQEKSNNENNENNEVSDQLITILSRFIIMKNGVILTAIGLVLILTCFLFSDGGNSKRSFLQNIGDMSIEIAEGEYIDTGDFSTSYSEDDLEIPIKYPLFLAIIVTATGIVMIVLSKTEKKSI